jgi:hypothetical protein
MKNGIKKKIISADKIGKEARSKSRLGCAEKSCFGKTNKILKSSLDVCSPLYQDKGENHLDKRIISPLHNFFKNNNPTLTFFSRWKKDKTILRIAISNCPKSPLLQKKKKNSSRKSHNSSLKILFILSTVER